MNKAFIFDMDGVIVDSESIWISYEEKFLTKLIGRSTYVEIRDELLGNSISAIYKLAKKKGLKLTKKQFNNLYDQYAQKVYKEAPLIPNVWKLITKLLKSNFKLGLVSSSRKISIDLVLKKLHFNPFGVVISTDAQNLHPKPYPDGFLKAMKVLNSDPEKTYILEDTPKGVLAARRSGAFTICLLKDTLASSKPSGADLYVKNINELITKLKL